MRSHHLRAKQAWACCLIAAWAGISDSARAEPFLHGRTVAVQFEQRPDAAMAPGTTAPGTTEPDGPLPRSPDRPLVPSPVDDESALLPEPPEGWGFDPLDGVAVPYVIEPWISVTGQLVWLHRSEGDRTTALVDVTTATSTSTVLSTDHLTFPTEAGVRASVLLGPASGRYFELMYLGVFDQEASGSVNVSPTGVVSTTTHFFNVDTISLTNYAYTAVTDSSLHSPELNLWLNETRWRFRPMLGLRWIQQSEDFQLFETSAPGNGNVLSLANDLVGGQLGFHTVLWQRTDRFGVQAVCKGGWYRNGIDLQAAQNVGGTTVATLTRSTTSSSVSGEVNLTAVWQLTPHLNFHVGYTGLWLTEVAAAADQLDNFDLLTGAGTVDLGTVSYQGGHLGVTYSW